jgi:hypothetical protein
MYRSSAGYRIIINTDIREHLKLAYICEVMNEISKDIPRNLGEKMSVILVGNSKESFTHFVHKPLYIYIPSYIGQYTLTELNTVYRRYKHKRPKHILL